jgi:hypothetical protein
MVDIKGLDKAKVLKALYDHSHVQGLGFMHAAEEGTVTAESCAELLEKYTQFDYLHGRVLKVDLSGDEFDERLYDRDCGAGAAQRAVDSIRDETEGEKKEPSLEEQAEMTKEAVRKIMDILNELPPTCHIVASMTLKMVLSRPVSSMTEMLMMGGPHSPSALFRSVEKPMGWPTGMGPIFGHDLFAHSRNG